MASKGQFEIKLAAATLPGWPCPRCGGFGTLPDGKLSMNSEGMTFTPPTKCSTCNGVGRVKLVAFTEEELKRKPPNA